MVMSSFMPKWKRFFLKIFPFLFRKCPHGNIGWRTMYMCYCMINSSDGSKWSNAIALRINKEKWIPVKEYIQTICDCGKKSNISKCKFLWSIVKCWGCDKRIDNNKDHHEPKSNIKILEI